MSYRTPDRCEIPDRIPWGVSSTLFRDPCLQMEQEERRAQLGLGCDAAARGQEKECCGVMGFIRNRYSFQIRVRVRATDSHTIEWYVESLTLPRHAPDSSWKTVSQLEAKHFIKLRNITDHCISEIKKRTEYCNPNMRYTFYFCPC